MKINLLSPVVYNRISAGEVVEKPASIVKELVENSIDAGAKNIRIEIENGGIGSITVADDGCGIEKDDLTTAFLPHATSKIKNVDDLDNILSLGFRGEALASISAVCQVKLSSKTADSQVGYSIKVSGGVFDDIVEIARSNGTTITCANLFFNTPVRAKFLRKPKTEESEITHLVEKFMLSNPELAFSYYVDGKQIYNTKSCSMSDIIYTIYGKEIYDNLIPVNLTENGFTLTGYVTKPKVCKSNRTYQTLFVNGRYVENYLISSAVQGVYESFLMKGKFPVYVLSLKLPADCVDVNVHPSKREVKFDNPNRIYSIVRRAVENALLSVDQIANFSFEDSKISDYDRIPSVSPLQKQNNAPQNNESASGSTHASASPYVTPSQNAQNAGRSSQQKNSWTPSGEGRSYSVDLFDRDAPLLNPDDFGIEIKKVSDYEREKGIVDAENKENGEKDDELKSLQNLSLKKEYIITSKDESRIFFDKSEQKYINEIQEKSSVESFLNADIKSEMKILGTLFSTYIVIEHADSVYFIDQHAAHERLLYDKLVKSIDEGNIARQDLLAPYTFTVGAKEASQIDGLLDDLENIGFIIEKNGNTFKITSLPFVLCYLQLDKFVDELLKENGEWAKKPSDYIHEKLCQTACKHAIKAGDNITKDECAYLIEQVRKGVMLCPHGRPISLVITRHEFEKMFKRIV